ncbi:MAG TPA: hypothetical protein VFE92_14675 [Dermatophilaceae bacterium]|nr:hypothetical protein [Dermatophilaceae bacterium]
MLTSRAGMSRSASQPTALSPSTIAAVVAVFAARQVAPAAVTVRHRPLVGSPVRGSIRWCRMTPSRIHRLAAVLEVASQR